MKSAAAIAAVVAVAPLSLHAMEYSRAEYVMGTELDITVPSGPRADEQTRAALAEARRLEAMLTTWRDDGELARVNRGAAPSPELYALLERVTKEAGETGGAFDPLIRPLIDAWGTRGTPRTPSEEQLRDAMRACALRNATFDGKTIALANGAAFEEGGFGKGYAIDRMLAVVRERGAAYAVINFGGQIGSFGQTIDVGIAEPLARRREFATLRFRGGSLSTSSNAEQGAHIIDPRSGRPVPARGSVSVIHPSALMADLLSTALYVMGPDEGLRWARAHGVTAIFITPARELITSSPVDGLTIRKKD